MAPQLWARQLEAGAGGITAATPAQLRAMRSVGVPSVLLANEVVDAGAIAWIGHETSTDLACWVDSVEGVELLADGLAAANGPPLPGAGGGRTSRRAHGRPVAGGGDRRGGGRRAPAGARARRGRRVRGHDRARADARRARRRRRVPRACSPTVSDRSRAGLVDGPPILSAGGSLFFDRVAALAGPERRVVLRAGCTITHDHGLYERGSPFADGPGPRFRPAIEAWGSVLSRPEPEVAVIGLGKRDVPSDIEPPIPLRMRDDDRSLAGMRVERLMDQHAICRVPAELSLASRRGGRLRDLPPLRRLRPAPGAVRAGRRRSGRRRDRHRVLTLRRAARDRLDLDEQAVGESDLHRRPRRVRRLEVPGVHLVEDGEVREVGAGTPSSSRRRPSRSPRRPDRPPRCAGPARSAPRCRRARSRPSGPSPPGPRCTPDRRSPRRGCTGAPAPARRRAGSRDASVCAPGVTEDAGGRRTGDGARLERVRRRRPRRAAPRGRRRCTRRRHRPDRPRSPGPVRARATCRRGRAPRDRRRPA